MKISEELSDSYLHCLASSNGNVKTVCDALQQAVAENLEMEFRFGSAINRVMFKHDQKKIDEINRMHFYVKTDWLAEADKLLRGQK